MNEEFLWTEKYRPKTIADCVLPKDIETTLLNFIKEGDTQNLLFFGGAGCGKTTAARALCNDLGADTMFINASNENSIDILRTKLTNFVTSGSLLSGGKRKIVILDEADMMSAAFMSALKAFIEEYSSNAGFILTANHQNKIIDPLRSRLLNIEFNLRINPDILMARYFKSLVVILDKENITYDQRVLAKLIQQFFPDFRRVLSETQRYSIGGTIDTGIFSNIRSVDVDTIMEFIRDKQWTPMREYFQINADTIDPSAFVENIYDVLDTYVSPESLPIAIEHIYEYERDSFLSVNKKIALIYLCTHLMSDVVFK